VLAEIARPWLAKRRVSARLPLGVGDLAGWGVAHAEDNAAAARPCRQICGVETREPALIGAGRVLFLRQG
jgi:hypothetical protein